ncbi:MAG: flagellar basal body P-ring protein FlgI [Nitratireductor sp.]|nr:flagellar basal body P-ring protein FlgI [Nitratireductor sp.]
MFASFRNAVFSAVRALQAAAVLIAFALCVPAHSEVRIKDVVSIQSERPNQLIGYGLVIGLNGTGDSMRNAPFSDASMRSMLDQLGIGISSGDIRTKNVAAVLVTANLPAYANKGTRIDVNISSIGDATSLRGGTLVFTPLYGGDGEIYASAQGGLIVSSFQAEGDAASVTSNTPTAARIPNAGIVERSAPGSFSDEKLLVLALSNPDYETAVEIADSINEYTGRSFGTKLAREVDNRSVEVKVPNGTTPARFYAAIGKLLVTPDTPARVVVDERTGTVIIGEAVKVSKVAITHGGLTVSVSERPTVSQPNPFSKGVTAEEPRTDIYAGQDPSKLNIVDGTDLRQLVNGLNVMGADAAAIIAILQAMRTAGALQAELIVQ